MIYDLNLSDPSNTSFYIPIILSLIVILLFLELIIHILKSRSDNVNSSIDNTLQQGLIYSHTFIIRKNTLKFRYLTGYVLTRASMWSKSPYLYTLYSTYHKFEIEEIGVLYIIDAISAFFAGPFTGNLADKYGRKLFCLLYNFLVIVNTLMRMTGSRTLAYVAQILTGVSGGLIMTVFESWVVMEANKEFGERFVEKERFLKKLFKTQNILDAIMSVLISSICAISYSLWGLFAPLWISITFSLIGMFCMFSLWAENKSPENIIKGMVKSFAEAFSELRKREVLSMGLIESLFQAVINIYLFIWTPILQNSTEKQMNVGFIFTCFVIALILGTTLFEIFMIYLRCEYYISITLSLLLELLFFIFVYYIENFMLRMILLAGINGISGFVNPLNSIIKSRILIEEHRATLMSIFRIPLNFYVIIVLVSLRYMNPFTVCLVACGMISIAFLISLSLTIWKPKPAGLKSSETLRDSRFKN